MRGTADLERMAPPRAAHISGRGADQARTL